ncbi:hypothetical protein GCM10010512_01740 [Streptomyces thermoviolaceus subsp. thermoviolaceus]|uniref:Class F sortase n=1 Tax=Streptomyces thermoviolaceus subsp. thermoviolaceus TaxID=66860 RepID=A0ABX0YYK2_STRTL|nr:class F sortase [Streptomyces thermoviolaceus]NJP17379.1 class F sortase [Streptomyces thermoviolaceus subsp. thermoviolaceus]WTD46176.1 class F sortase [Streptomyces thermoviolaceus]GHA75075.1 hypothetical protein GCM10010512_01740 [Streptomyces thermoviolaceus subsp. thermoviolaceus]
MASHRPPQTEQRGTVSGRRRGRLRLLFPAAAVGLGIVLIHNSLDSSPVTQVHPSGRPASLASRQAPTPTEQATAPSAPSAPSAAPSATAGPGRPAPATGAAPDDDALPRSEPTRISIPKIGVDAPFTKLSLDTTGRLNPPPENDKNLVGWYQGGPAPGERGASVVVGHIDTKTGPAVFVELPTLKPGDEVDIARADGVVARFEVDAVEVFSKSDFPDDLVYGDTPSPELRLITCGGTFDKARQDYRDNIVVFAHLDSTARA